MILLGGFDLSVGAVGAASSVFAAWTMGQFGIVPGILAALAVGLVVGLGNGSLIAGIGINPFVVTLGTQVLVTGILYVMTDAAPVYGVPDEFTVVGLGRLGRLDGVDEVERGAGGHGSLRARSSHGAGPEKKD